MWTAEKKMFTYCVEY